MEQLDDAWSGIHKGFENRTSLLSLLLLLTSMFCFWSSLRDLGADLPSARALIDSLKRAAG